MSQSEDLIADMRVRITRIVRDATGMHERLALPIACAILDELQREHGGGPLYIPAPSRQGRDIAIRDAWQCGMPPAAIADTYGLHRSTVYRVIGAKHGG